jgi:hypothetical protein
MNSTDEHEVVSLIVRYGFDLGGQQAAALVRLWSNKYDRTWLLPATIEALNRGRYKVASIEQVLQSWQRQGHMTVRFDQEFAQMVLGRSPQAESHQSKTHQFKTMEESQEAIEESSLDAEIHQFSDQELQEAHQFAADVGLSQPALDEDTGSWGNSNTQLLHERVPFKSGVVSDLTASSYPPAKLRKPGEEEILPPRMQIDPEDVFEPTPQVSQFYYRLLEMANSSPLSGSKANLTSVAEPQLKIGG